MHMESLILSVNHTCTCTPVLHAAPTTCTATAKSLTRLQLHNILLVCTCIGTRATYSRIHQRGWCVSTNRVSSTKLPHFDQASSQKHAGTSSRQHRLANMSCMQPRMLTGNAESPGQSPPPLQRTPLLHFFLAPVQLLEESLSLSLLTSPF